MPHNHCPPSLRGHSWRELYVSDLPHRSSDALKISPALRICKRCNTFGRVSKQGVIHVVEAP